MAARGEAQADVEVSTLVVPAWRLRWRAPELALVLGERAVALASARRDEVDRLRAEALVVFASNRVGRGVRVADRALDALKAAEAEAEHETAWRLRVELAHTARSVGAPLTGFAAVRPVLEAEDVPDALRASALVQASECLVSVGRGSALTEALDEADRLYTSDPVLDHDTALLLRGQLRAAAACQHRRWGDLDAAIAAAREGVELLDQLSDADADSGQVRGDLVVELVCALLDADKPGEASETGTPLLERPVRAPSAASSGWLRLALATRVHLPAGRVDQARELLHEAADNAERHQLDTLHAESLLALAHVHEVSGHLTEALANLRSAHAAERRRARAVYAVRARLAAEFSGVHRRPSGLHDQLTAVLRQDTEVGDRPETATLTAEAKQQLRQWRPVQAHRPEGLRVKRSRRAAEDMTVEGISAARAHAADRWRLVHPFGDPTETQSTGGRRRAPESDATPGRPDHTTTGQARPTRAAGTYLEQVFGSRTPAHPRSTPGSQIAQPQINQPQPGQPQPSQSPADQPQPGGQQSSRPQSGPEQAAAPRTPQSPLPGDPPTPPSESVPTAQPHPATAAQAPTATSAPATPAPATPTAAEAAPTEQAAPAAQHAQTPATPFTPAAPRSLADPAFPTAFAPQQPQTPSDPLGTPQAPASRTSPETPQAAPRMDSVFPANPFAQQQQQTATPHQTVQSPPTGFSPTGTAPTPHTEPPAPPTPQAGRESTTSAQFPASPQAPPVTQVETTTRFPVLPEPPVSTQPAATSGSEAPSHYAATSQWLADSQFSAAREYLTTSRFQPSTQPSAAPEFPTDAQTAADTFTTAAAPSSADVQSPAAPRSLADERDAEPSTGQHFSATSNFQAAPELPQHLAGMRFSTGEQFPGAPQVPATPEFAAASEPAEAPQSTTGEQFPTGFQSSAAPLPATSEEFPATDTAVAQPFTPSPPAQPAATAEAEAGSSGRGESGERTVPAAGLIAAAGAMRSGRRRAAREAAEEETVVPQGSDGGSVLETLKAAGLLDSQRSGGRRRRASEAEEEADDVQWRVEAPQRLREAANVNMFDSPEMIKPSEPDEDVPPQGLGAAFIKGPVIPTARVPEPVTDPLPVPPISPSGFLGFGDVEQDDPTPEPAPAVTSAPPNEQAVAEPSPADEATGTPLFDADPADSTTAEPGTGDETVGTPPDGTTGNGTGEPFIRTVVVGGTAVEVADDSPSATRASRRPKSDLSLAELLAEALVAYEAGRREDEAAQAQLQAGPDDEPTGPITAMGGAETDNETTTPIERVTSEPPRWTLPES